jgi:hypothetical protein
MRGVVELPAIFIFIAVAGGLLMLFFITLAFQQGEHATESIELASLQRLETLIKSSATARETENNITIIDDPLSFRCDETGIRFGYESNNALVLQDQLVFSPRSIPDGQLHTYSKGTRAGYRVATILYVSSPAYLLSTATTLYNFPPVIEPQNIDRLRAKDIPHRVVLTIEQYREVLEQPGPEPVDAVIIDEQGTGYGNVRYIRNGIQTGKVVYPNNELLYGAILSYDEDTYNCVLTEYLHQLQWVNIVERDRVMQLKTVSNLEAPQCYAYYQDSPFDTIANLPTQATEFTLDNAATLHEAASQIEFMNDNLIRGDHCAWIY